MHSLQLQRLSGSRGQAWALLGYGRGVGLHSQVCWERLSVFWGLDLGPAGMELFSVLPRRLSLLRVITRNQVWQSGQRKTCHLPHRSYSPIFRWSTISEEPMKALRRESHPETMGCQGQRAWSHAACPCPIPSHTDTHTQRWDSSPHGLLGEKMCQSPQMMQSGAQLPKRDFNSKSSWKVSLSVGTGHFFILGGEWVCNKKWAT